jgi:N-acetylmuramoyl-L-alanine amidase
MKLRIVSFFITALGGLALFSSSVAALERRAPQPAQAAKLQARHEIRKFHVVLDPGHGGSDHGASFRSRTKTLREKDLTLALAREAARALRHRGIEVTLTRTQDQELPLPVRTQFANRLSADAFISIHLNSTHSGEPSGAEGIETYILNNTTEASSRRLAQLENSVLGNQLEVVESDQTDVALILKDLQLDGNLAESKRLACLLQGQLVQSTNALARNRGVKQALFHVLLGADMPSALIEAGFLTSARDRALIATARGQRVLGLAIARAVEAFRHARGQPLARTLPASTSGAQIARLCR